MTKEDEGSADDEKEDAEAEATTEIEEEWDARLEIDDDGSEGWNKGKIEAGAV